MTHQQTIDMADRIAEALFGPPRRFNCTLDNELYRLRGTLDGRWLMERSGVVVAAYPNLSACDAIELAEQDGFEFDAEVC